MRRSALACLILILVAAGAAWADDGQPYHPPTNLEIPFLARDIMGARWTAMGGACIAVVDDGSAMYLNPAGLGKIRRIEVLGTIQKQTYDVDATWFGTTTSRSLSSTRFRDFTLSFPFPTYRGSFVMAGSVFRTHMLDAYTVRSGTNPDDDQIYHDSDERSGALTAWGAGMSLQVAPNTFVGIEAHIFSGDYNETDLWDLWYYYADDDQCRDAVFSWKTDLSGYGATFGVQYEPASMVGLGLTVRTPQEIKIKGEIVETDPYYCDNGLFEIDDEASLPYQLGLGLAFMPPGFLLTVDVVYTGWHELTYPGPTRDEETDDYIYDPTTDLRAGLEYTLGFAPVRFRAGYAHVPLELNWFDVKKNRRSVAFGIGTVVESSLAIDGTWQRTSFERELAADSYSEKRTIDRVVMTLAYRF